MAFTYSRLANSTSQRRHWCTDCIMAISPAPLPFLLCHSNASPSDAACFPSSPYPSLCPQIPRPLSYRAPRRPHATLNSAAIFLNECTKQSQTNAPRQLLEIAVGRGAIGGRADTSADSNWRQLTSSWRPDCGHRRLHSCGEGDPHHIQRPATVAQREPGLDG